MFGILSSNFSLSTSARIRTQDPVQSVSPRWSVTDRPWAPCFNGIEGSLVIWFDRGFHRFNTDQRSVPSLLRVPRVWNRGLPRQGSCNRGHPTLPVDVPRVVIVKFFIESLLRTFPEKVSDLTSVYNRQSICLQLTEHCAQPTE